VTIKPVRSKPQLIPKVPGSPSEDLLHRDQEEAVPETQEVEPRAQVDAGNFDSDSGSEYTASEGGTRYRRPNQQKKTKDRTGEGRVKTAARKVGAMAHANFKRLKLRNSGSKGGVAHNSRFRRKR
jgi:DNA replication regulator SLD2